MTATTTIIQTQTVADSTPGWSVPLSFDQFNPTLGLLSSVDVGIVGNVQGSAAIENLGATAASLQIDIPATIDVAASNGTVLASVAPVATTTLNLGAYDGTPNFAGTSGTVVSDFSNAAIAVSSYVPGPGGAVPIYGTGSFDLTASSQASSSVTAGGNLLSLTEGKAGAAVSVQYNYLPMVNSSYTTSGSYTSFDLNAVALLGGLFETRTTTPQTLAASDRTTGWSTILAANQFNPALGTLESVNITVVGDINAGLAAENLGSAAAAIGLTETADITLSLPGSLGAVTAAPSISSSTNLAAFDGTIDFAGLSGENLTGLTKTQPTTSDLTSYSGNLAPFVGTGTIALPIAAISPSTLTGPADLAAELLTDAGATVTISYTYSVPIDQVFWPQGVVVTVVAGSTASVTPPTITGTQADQAVTDLTAIPPFSAVVIADPNAGQTETVTVTLSNPANGTLTNLGGGNYDAAAGVYTTTGSAAAVTADLRGLVFDPAEHEVAPGQTVTTGLTITDTDTAGATATDRTASVTATAEAVAPAITGTEAGQGVTNQTTAAPFANVLITDPNLAQTETVTVTQSAPANGTLSNLGGGTYDQATGIYTVTGSAGAVTGALDGLVFTPAAVAPGQTIATGFTISDIDTVGATATDTATTVSATAGATIDTAAAAAAIEAEIARTAVPLTIAGTVSNQVVAAQAAIDPFANVVIADPNIGQTDTVTVTLSAAANGTLTNLGGGSYNAATGVYTDAGSAAAVTKALNGLAFTPTSGETTLGQRVTTSFTIGATDTAGASATSTATSVVTTSAGPVWAEGAAQGETGQAPWSPASGIGGVVAGIALTSAVALGSASTNGTMRFIYGASSNATLAATPGTPDEFVFTSFASGPHTITGFSAVEDSIAFSRSEFANFAAIQAAITATPRGAMIHLGSSGSLRLPGVEPSSLHESNFVLTGPAG